MTAATLQENKMGVMPVGKLIANMALPMVISMLVQALYNVVDSIYVSQVSESAVTALSLAFPIQNLLIGFAVGIGVGVNSLLSKSLGEKNQEAANRAAGNGIVLMAIAMVLFVLFGLFGVRPYFAIQSDNPETVEGGIVYTSICCVFSVGCFASILGERLLQSTGRTVHTMITQSIGAIINIILDPILIHGWFGLPAMGIAGAAIATVIGQWDTIKNDIYTFSQDVEVILDNYINIHNRHRNESIEHLMKGIEDKDPNLELYNVYTSTKLRSICFTILDQLVRQENLPIKTCQICGRYFIPTFRQNEIYCDLPNVDGSATCREKGATINYKKNLESVPALGLYRKMYQQKVMVVYRNKEDRKIKKDFDKWKKEAQAKIKLFKQGKLDEDALYKWMEENK